jgi:hypothetical protein
MTRRWWWEKGKEGRNVERDRIHVCMYVCYAQMEGAEAAAFGGCESVLFGSEKGEGAGWAVLAPSLCNLCGEKANDHPNI